MYFHYSILKTVIRALGKVFLALNQENRGVQIFLLDSDNWGRPSSHFSQKRREVRHPAQDDNA